LTGAPGPAQDRERSVDGRGGPVERGTEGLMLRILYVEDNPDNLYLLQRRLTRAGFEMTIAMSGLQGIEAAAASRPDLILMDLNLPGINGWEATRRLKSRPDTKDIPIIALSAHHGASHRAEAFAAGVVRYEEKPVDFDHLLATIREVLGHTGPA
jgi:CheY-like chemotaxis protein